MRRPPEVLEVPFEITVCDAKGTVLAMNDASAALFRDRGGRALVGKSLFDCHPGASRRKLARLLRSRRVNVYTIERHGARRIIVQAPWYRRGRYAGYVEVSVPLPKKVPHFVRGRVQFYQPMPTPTRDRRPHQEYPKLK